MPCCFKIRLFEALHFWKACLVKPSKFNVAFLAFLTPPNRKWRNFGKKSQFSIFKRKKRIEGHVHVSTSWAYLTKDQLGNCGHEQTRPFERIASCIIPEWFVCDYLFWWRKKNLKTRLNVKVKIIWRIKHTERNTLKICFP